MPHTRHCKSPDRHFNTN